MKIISSFDTEDGATIKCVCGVVFIIFFGSPKACSCGREYEIIISIHQLRKRKAIKGVIE